MNNVLNEINKYILKNKNNVNRYNTYIIYVLNNNNVLEEYRGLNRLNYKFIKDKKLYIYETESSIKFVLERKKSEIIKKINKYFNDEVITDIIIITKNYEIEKIKNNEILKKRKINFIEFNEDEYLKKIEMILKEEEDLEKREKLKEKYIKFEKNRINMINNGYIYCEKCKNLFYTEYENKKICIRCQNKIEKQKYSIMYNILKKDIKISYEKISKEHNIERIYYDRAFSDIVTEAQNDLYYFYNNLIENIIFYDKKSILNNTKKVKEKIKKYLYLKYKGADSKLYEEEEYKILKYFREGILKKIENENDI